MTEERIEFKWLEVKTVGTNTVVFRLEDGAMVKVRVDIDRAGVATNYANPDGTPNYNIGASLHINVIPSSKKFSVPKSQVIRPPPPKERTVKPI